MCILSLSLFSAGQLVKPTLAGAATYSSEYHDTPLVFDSSKRIPTVDPDVGDGSLLSTDPSSLIPINNLSPKVKSALVRITAHNPPQSTKIFAGAYSILEAVPNTTTSNTFLAPIIAGGVNVWAQESISVRVEVVASFESNVNVAGSIIALENPVRRADTMHDLAGQSLSKGIQIGTIGQGGVPSSGVRSIFYTLYITTMTDNSVLQIGGNKVNIPYRGNVHVSSVLVPDENGNTFVKLTRGESEDSAADGFMSLDVRGYVVDSTPKIPAINSEGSFVPKIGADNLKLDVKEGQSVDFEVPNTSLDSQYSLFLVQVSDQTSHRPTTIDVGDHLYSRELGISVDPQIGTLPQLIVAKIEGRESSVKIHHGSATVYLAHVGDIIGKTTSEEDSSSRLFDASLDPPEVTITSPQEAARIDYKEALSVKITGTITEKDYTAATTSIWSDYQGGFEIGAAQTHYTETGQVHWSIEICPPQSGNYTFTILVKDRMGFEARAQVSVFVEMFDPAEQGIVFWPKTRAIDDGSRYIKIEPDSVLMYCDDTIAPGNTLYTPSTPQTPQGLIRKVLSVDVVQDKCKYTTEEGDISDVAQNVQLDYQQIDATNTITQEALDAVLREGVRDENGERVPGVSLDAVKLVDEDEVGFLHKEDFPEQASNKPSFCTPDFKPLDDTSDCSLQPKLDDFTRANQPLDDDIAASEGASAGAAEDENQGSSDKSPGVGSVDEANPSEDAPEGTNTGDSIVPGDSQQGNGSTVGENQAYHPPKVNALTGELLPASGSFARAGSEKLTRGRQALLLSDALRKGVLKRGSSNGSKALHFEFSFSATLTLSNGTPSANFALGQAKPVKEPTRALEKQNTTPVGDGDGSEAREPDKGWETKTNDPTKGSVTINFALKYTKDIKIYVDAGASFRIWFPSWHFWDIHIDLDVMLAKATEQMTQYEITLNISAVLNKKLAIATFIFPLAGGAVMFEFGVELYVKGSINGRASYVNKSFNYERNGYKFHNFNKQPINEKKSNEVETSYSGFLEFSLEIGVALSLSLVFVGFVYIGFTLTVGVKLSLGVYSYVPQGTSQTMAKGKVALDFVLTVSLGGGLNFRIFKIGFSANLVNLVINLYTITFSAEAPTTNIGRAVIITGISTSDTESISALRNATNQPVFEVLKKVGDMYLPVPIVQLPANDYTAKYSKTDAASAGRETDIDVKSIFTSRSSSDLKIPTKANGTDGVLYLSSGNPLPVNELSSKQKTQLLEALGDDLGDVDADSISQAFSQADSLSQLGFVSPDASGGIVLDYLSPGDYQLKPVLVQNGVKPQKPNYNFTIADWMKNSTTHSGWNWNSKLVKAQVAVPLVFAPKYTVQNTIRNASREQKFPSAEDTTPPSTETLVRPGDVVELKTQVDYPDLAAEAQNMGDLINSKLFLDETADSGDASVNFSSPGLQAPTLTCDYGDGSSASSLPNQRQDLITTTPSGKYVNLGIWKQNAFSYAVDVDGKSDTTSFNAEGYTLPPGSRCTLLRQGVVEKIGYFATRPTLQYDLPANTTLNPPNPGSVNGSTLEAYGTELTFKNMQKYTYPLVYVPCVEYELTRTDSASASVPQEVSSVSADLTKPFAGLGQVDNTCANATVATDLDSSSHIFSSQDITATSGEEYEPGIIDLYYLTPGSYRLTQFSAPEHYKQTGVVVDFDIAKPSQSAPAAGRNDQGIREIPPEIVANITVSVDDATSQQQYGDPETREFLPGPDGKVSFTGENQDYKGAPGDASTLTYHFEYPACTESEVHICNIGASANPYLTTSMQGSDTMLDEEKYRFLFAEGDTQKYPRDVAKTERVGLMNCLVYPYPVDAQGNVTPISDDKACANTPKDPGALFAFKYVHAIHPGYRYDWVLPENLTLLRNQTPELDASMDGDDGTPSKGRFDSVRFNRGFASIFTKERNSYPLEGTAQALAGIGVGEVDFTLYKANGELIGEGRTNALQPEQKFKVLDTATTTSAISTPIEHLEEGEYYFMLKAPSGHYSVDAEQKYPFSVKYKRLEADRARGQLAPDGSGALVDDWYLSTRAYIDYTPGFELETKVRNLTRNGEESSSKTPNTDDIFEREGDILEYTAQVRYTPESNSALAYSPELRLSVTRNLDTEAAQMKITRTGSATFEKTLPFSAAVDFGTADAENVYNTSSDEVNIGAGRTAFGPGDTATITWQATAKDNAVGKVVSNIWSEYTQQANSFSSDSDNVSYPGHLALKVAERWAEQRFIPNVPFKLYKDTGAPETNSEEQNIVNFSQLPNDDNYLASAEVKPEVQNVVWSDAEGNVSIDYIPNGHYILQPDTENPLWPEGYILGENLVNGYENDVSLNENSYEADHTALKFSIDDYQLENALVSINLGVFELYYQPQIFAALHAKNVTRGDPDFASTTQIKPGDQVEYHYTAKYPSTADGSSSISQRGLLHQPKLLLRDNSGQSLEIDAETFALQINGQSVDVQYSGDDKPITLPDLLEPGAELDLTFSAQIDEVDAAMLWVEFRFDHLYFDSDYPEARADIYRSSAVQTATELHSLGTIFLDGAHLALYRSDGTRVDVKSAADPGNPYSSKALPSGEVQSQGDAVDTSGLRPEQAKGVEKAANFIREEYLEPGQYYFAQTLAPQGYELTAAEKFPFEVPEFRAEDYIQGEKYSEQPITEIVQQNDALSRTYFIDNDLHTVWFDYTPVFEMQTSVRNASRAGSDFAATTIAKPGDTLELLVRFDYPKDTDEGNVHNRGIIYGASLLDSIHNSENVQISRDGGKTFEALGQWQDDGIEFGMHPGDETTADNAQTRILPGETLWLSYQESYAEPAVVKYDDKITHLYDKRTAERYLSSWAGVYYGKINLETFERLLDGSQTALGNVKLQLYGAKAPEPLSISSVADVHAIFAGQANNDEAASGVFTNKESGSASVEYVEPGDYYFKVLHVPQGNLRDPEAKYRFTVPEVDFSQDVQNFDVSRLNVDLNAIEIGVRRVEFSALSSMGEALPDTSISVARPGSDERLHFNSPQFNEGGGLYTTNASGKILLDHVADGELELVEEIATKGYEFTREPKVSLKVENQHWVFGTDDTLHAQNNANVALLSPQASLQQQNTTRSAEQTDQPIDVHASDLVKVFVDATAPVALSPGSYRSWGAQVSASEHFEPAPLYVDVRIDGQRLSAEDYSVQQDGSLLNVLLSEDAVKEIHPSAKISLQAVFRAQDGAPPSTPASLKLALLPNDGVLPLPALVQNYSASQPGEEDSSSDESALGKYDDRSEGVPGESDVAAQEGYSTPASSFAIVAMLQQNWAYLLLVLLALALALAVAIRKGRRKR